VLSESSIPQKQTESEDSEQTVNVDRPFWKDSQEDDGEHTEDEQFREKPPL
jgi:hypothetical protein